MSFQDRGQVPARICLGKIIGAHGVKGLVKILSFGDDPKLIETLGPVYTSETGDQTLRIVLKNSQGKHWLATVDGISDRTDAEKLGKPQLFIEKSKLPEIKEKGVYYHADLIGLTVQDEQGQAIGRIDAVDNFGAGDLLDIRPVSGKPFYLPFRKEFIVKTDIEAGHITVKDIERMRLE